LVSEGEDKLRDKLRQALACFQEAGDMEGAGRACSEVNYYKDREEVLAILEACDLVITTSNATAHFAGVLGKRAWLLYTRIARRSTTGRTAAATAPSGILRWRSSRRPISTHGRR
jgi:hypothetical protein